MTHGGTFSTDIERLTAYSQSVSAFLIHNSYFFCIFAPMFLFNFFRKRHKKTAQRPLTDEAYNDLRAEIRKEVDRILEKINKNGYDSLKASERDFLNKNKDRI